MTTTYQVRDKNRSFFTIIPNYIDDAHLSLEAYRLYGHLKRVAGEEGTCYQSTKTMAEKCCMSVGSIVKAKQELTEKNLIDIKLEPGVHGGRAYHVITITDIWDRNVPQNQDRSPHEHPSSCGELASSCGEPINIPINKNISTIANAIVDPAPQEPTPTTPDPIPEKPNKPERSPLEQEIMTRYSRKRPLNESQRAIVLEIEKTYPQETIQSWLTWAIVSEIPLGNALNGSRKALAKWNKPKTNGNGHQPAAKNKGGFILDPGEYQVVYPEENLAKDKVYQQLFGGAQ